MQGKAKFKEVFTIVEVDKLDRPVFRRIGTGFINKDASLNVILDALPSNGRLHIRDPLPRREDKKEAA